MKIEEKELKRLIEAVKNKKYEAFIEIRSMFSDYADSLYQNYIGSFHGNQYQSYYASLVDDEIIAGVHEFRGVEVKRFCAYINKRIKNCCLKFLRDYVKDSCKVVSLEEYYEVTSITEYSEDMIRVEEYVTTKLANEQLIHKELMSKLSKKERDVLEYRLDDNETIEEYAKREKCKQATVRAYMSKAIKKLRNNPEKNKLAREYLINY